MAGAHLTLAQALRRIVNQVGVELDAALRMVTSIPAQVIGRPALGHLVGRTANDTLVLHDDITVRGTLASVASEDSEKL